jgi:hypothetical protein
MDLFEDAEEHRLRLLLFKDARLFQGEEAGLGERVNLTSALPGFRFLERKLINCDVDREFVIKVAFRSN